MTDESQDVGSVLNSLISACLDGEKGYRAAAGDVKNTELESVFLKYAEQRAKFARELSGELERLGGEPAQSGTVGGALHRGWMDVKSALTRSSAAAIVAACETGEDSAEAAYGRATDSVISGHTRDVIEKQANQVREAHSFMKRLKAETESGAAFQKNE